MLTSVFETTINIDGNFISATIRNGELEDVTIEDMDWTTSNLHTLVDELTEMLNIRYQAACEYAREHPKDNPVKLPPQEDDLPPGMASEDVGGGTADESLTYQRVHVHVPPKPRPPKGRIIHDGPFPTTPEQSFTEMMTDVVRKGIRARNTLIQQMRDIIPRLLKNIEMGQAGFPMHPDTQKLVNEAQAILDSGDAFYHEKGTD